jgi:transcriptional regulator with XRE-family HTH domain
MANERLRQALLTSGVSTDELAQRVGTDTKTVERWISTDRVPHRRNRASAAHALGVDESILWPQTADAGARAVVGSEVLHVFPDRGSVPPSSWYELLERAREHVDVLVFAGLFLSDSRADLPALVARQARDGVRVRLLLGDPVSDAVARRGAEEDIGDALAARIRMSLSYIAATFEIPGVSVRLHETTLYNSLYRFDDDLLVNMHAYGAVDSKSPVMHVRRIEGGRLFPHYMESFEKVWTAAKPLATQALARMNGTPH